MSLLGTVAAAATFVATGGNVQLAMLAYSVGSGVESVLMPPKIEGPRLNEREIQLASYGAPIPWEYGTNRHAGTVIWPKVIELTEHEHEESAKGGPEMTTYTYTCNMAVEICEGPIAGILKIFANKKVIYDATPGAEVQRDPAISGLRIYLGTEGQQPDPLIEATDGPSPAYLGYAYVVFEDLDLTDFANRPPQLEFIVVTEGESDIPPSTTFGEEFGISANNVRFKSAMDTGTGNVWVVANTGHAAINPETGKYEIDPAYGPKPQIQEYDPITKEILRVIELTPEEVQRTPINGGVTYANGYLFVGTGAPANTTTGYGLCINTETGARSIIDTPPCAGNPVFYYPSVPVPLIDNNGLYMMSGNGLSAGYGAGFMPRSLEADETKYDALPDRSGAEPRWNLPVSGTWSGRRHSILQPPTQPSQNLACEQAPLTTINFPGWAYKSFLVKNPNAVIVQGRNNGGDGSYLARIAHGPVVDRFSIDGPSDVSWVILPGSQTEMPPVAWDEKNEVFWAFAGETGRNTLYSIAVNGPSGMELTDTGFMFAELPQQSESDDVKAMVSDPATGNLVLLIGGGLSPSRLMLFDPIAQTVLQETPLDNSFSNVTGDLYIYPEQKKVIYSNGYALYDLAYGTTLDAAPVQLGAIVADLCRRAGLESSEIDVSQLTDMVDGYCVPRQMSARAAIEPLQTAFFFDAVESDAKLKFVKRAASSPILIPMEDRAARDFGADLPDSLSIVRAQDMELPVQVDVEYADIDADHLVGNQYERRITRDTKQRINIQSPVVMTAAKAKEVAVVTLYRAGLNQSYKFTTGRKWAHLEPTDLVTLPTSEASYTARITSKREQPSGVIEWEAAMESVEVYTQPVTGAAPTNYVRQTIYDPGSTTLELLDIPILRDADDNGGAYVAMAGTKDGWKGAQLFKSADGGSTYESVLIQSNEAAIGVAQSALPDFTGGNIFDAGSSVTVYMTSGQALTSATEDQVLNGANLAVIGQPGRWEAIQYKNATLIAPNTYQLSGFLRGRRGTEWATGLHQSGDAFIVASVATWNRLEAEDLGLPRLFKAPPFRTALSASSAQRFTNTAVALKPFSPVNLAGARDESGNLTLSWLRRTRLASNTLHLPTPLGEASEAYSIDILVGGAVVRTLSSSTPSVVYSAADQTADGIAPGAAVTARIYQLSQAVGRGYPLEGTL